MGRQRAGGPAPVIFECVVNVSEGRDDAVLAALADAASDALLDAHRDPHHNRAVLTLAGSAAEVASAARALATVTVARLDLRAHDGAHPRLGVLDVVPFVPYEPGEPAPTELHPAMALRDDFARWLGDELGVPAFLYGPMVDGGERSLPEVRRVAFRSAAEGGVPPDFGPDAADPRTGAAAVGARRPLVAYNVWVTPLSVARAVAPLLRRPGVRALGLGLGSRAQVSCNLVEPDRVGPAAVYDEVVALVERAGGVVEGAELVGLLPGPVLHAVPRSRWVALGLSEEATIESCLEARLGWFPGDRRPGQDDAGGGLPTGEGG
jgi:glutamate formiminotransferase / 5-formyltetrahydrofolate cyclo-ligase